MWDKCDRTVCELFETGREVNWDCSYLRTGNTVEVSNKDSGTRRTTPARALHLARRPDAGGRDPYRDREGRGIPEPRANRKTREDRTETTTQVKTVGSTVPKGRRPPGKIAVPHRTTTHATPLRGKFRKGISRSRPGRIIRGRGRGRTSCREGPGDAGTYCAVGAAVESRVPNARALVIWPGTRGGRGERSCQGGRRSVDLFGCERESTALCEVRGATVGGVGAGDSGTRTVERATRAARIWTGFAPEHDARELLPMRSIVYSNRWPVKGLFPADVWNADEPASASLEVQPAPSAAQRDPSTSIRILSPSPSPRHPASLFFSPGLLLPLLAVSPHY
ncbi:hypothetical protein Mp_1g27130 [Marchantia polymorpha subsp. ruderalis]|uniref:Uncharacterized protein n=2 Tax=Marchantia polymorpha TaxID=3197 RepID=A0AAF6AUS0_MARPO|nr:hypothetical protein MARPO_0002s0165 [Marchantia polymorpha]BBN00191.1 hypothetical protein Mp_1g27130 [Marchantia polymorpha subsp. ruderalis]|eukprot:PTQ49693.1 hypothetical protein MARPO_0002s0165 [Marchantia polymorpha]